jgi:uncharacterized protein (TIGR03086 family)
MDIQGSASIALLERADDQLRRLISRVGPAQAGLPTPCSDFNLRALVNHIVFDLHSFTAMISGGQRESPDVDLIGDDWPAAYVSSADSLLSAWRNRGTGGTLISRLGELPATWALGQHASNLVVHAWDLAKATGNTDDLDPELALTALAWGRENLKPEFRGQAFGAEVPVSENAPAYDRLAAFFGRQPGWSRPLPL